MDFLLLYFSSKYETPIEKESPKSWIASDNIEILFVNIEPINSIIEKIRFNKKNN